MPLVGLLALIFLVLMVIILLVYLIRPKPSWPWHRRTGHMARQRRPPKPAPPMNT